MSEVLGPRAVRYAQDRTTPFEGTLAQAASWTLDNTPWPDMMSGLVEARLLEALVVIAGARRVLEIGTFTAVGSLTMAAALGEGGTVTTLEVDESIAAVARRHIEESPYGHRVKLVMGDALASIAVLDGPFDLVYIDASKSSYPDYYDAVVEKLAPRGAIVADNLFRNGATLDPAVNDDGTLGMREFAERVQADPRMHNALLTVGDGLMLAWRAPAT